MYSVKRYLNLLCGCGVVGRMASMIDQSRITGCNRFDVHIWMKGNLTTNYTFPGFWIVIVTQVVAVHVEETQFRKVETVICSLQGVVNRVFKWAAVLQSNEMHKVYPGMVDKSPTNVLCGTTISIMQEHVISCEFNWRSMAHKRKVVCVCYLKHTHHVKFTCSGHTTAIIRLHRWQIVPVTLSHIVSV